MIRLLVQYHLVVAPLALAVWAYFRLVPRPKLLALNLRRRDVIILPKRNDIDDDSNSNSSLAA